MKKVIAYFIENSLILNLATAGLLIAGALFLLSARREAFPKVDFDVVIVETIYPGATASDVEKLVTTRIEDQLREIDGIDDLNSTSAEARSTIVIQLDPDLEDKDRTINDIRSAVDATEDLPLDAETPLVRELTLQNYPVISYSLIDSRGITNDAGEFELRRYADVLEERVKRVNGVAGVGLKGYRDREMIVEVSLPLLNTYHVALNEVIQALQTKNVNFPGGIARTGKEEILIRTIGEVERAEEISRVIIRSNDLGIPVRIGDVATVRDSFEEEREISKTQGEKSVVLTVKIKENFDIITMVDSVRKEVESFRKTIPSHYKIVETDDFSYYVKRRLSVLIGNGIVGFVLVIGSLLIAFGWRIAFVAALGIPLSFAGVFLWMGIADVSVNLMSMFGMIMVLGMLVDDAIVVSENIYRLIEEGVPLKEACIRGTSEVVIPVAGTILTTIAAFAPLLFMTGIMSKFVWVLPAVVSVALLFSWFESMLILPGHIHDMEKRSKKHSMNLAERERKHSVFMIRKRYRRLLEAVLNHKLLFAAGLVVVFIGTMVFGAVNLKFILFPPAGVEKFVVKLEAPSGIAIRETNVRTSAMESLIARLPKKELESYVTTVGISAEEDDDPGIKRGSNYASIIVNLTPETDRTRDAATIIEDLRKQSAVLKDSFAKMEFSIVKGGPPEGAPVSVTIKGEDIPVLQKIASRYKEHLGTIAGLKDIKDNYEDTKKELRIRVKPEIAARAGVSVLDVAQTVRSCFEGAVATKIRKTEEEITIRVILPESKRENLNSLLGIKVSNRAGNLIPLGNVAYFERAEGVTAITRKDWRRNITVSADIDPSAKGVSSVSVNTALQKKFTGIESEYPGYEVSYEGEFKDTQESFQQLLRSFLIAIMVIYIILVAIFKNMTQPLIVMSVIPLSFIGLIWSFWGHGLPISFLGLMGIVGLSGVIVNDSIVYVDFINKERERGHSLRESILNAGFNRVRAIMLTTITTVFGLLPTAYGIGGFDPFIKPMAIAMSWGLIFGVGITLFVTPVTYNIIYECWGLFARLRGRRCEDTLLPYNHERVSESLEREDREIEALKHTAVQGSQKKRAPRKGR